MAQKKHSPMSARVVYASAGAYSGDRVEVSSLRLSGERVVGIYTTEQLDPTTTREAVVLLTHDEATELRDLLNEVIR